ncbi:hypothetical protein LINGRAHAP2_LOCUS5987 [Linum grandiflorum]
MLTGATGGWWWAGIARHHRWMLVVISCFWAIRTRA